MIKINSKNKLAIILTIILATITILLTNLVSAVGDYSIDKQTLFPSETLTITLNPDTLGFYNQIYVFDSLDILKDTITVDCTTQCQVDKIVPYIIPANFDGDYYLAIYDYTIDNYVYLDFSVIPKAINNINIKDIDGTDLYVTPVEGQNANVKITAILSGWNCDTYSIDSYICDLSKYSSCSDTSYTYKIPLTLESQVAGQCTFSYSGNTNTPQFWKKPGTWKLYVKATHATENPITSSADFTYKSLKAIYYANYIQFNQLFSSQWNQGLPSSGEDIINHGNVELDLNWKLERFSCYSGPCTTTGDYWALNGNDAQIDDDNIHGEVSETGLNPSYIYSAPVYFPEQETETDTITLGLQDIIWKRWAKADCSYDGSCANPTYSNEIASSPYKIGYVAVVALIGPFSKRRLAMKFNTALIPDNSEIYNVILSLSIVQGGNYELADPGIVKLFSGNPENYSTSQQFFEAMAAGTNFNSSFKTGCPEGVLCRFNVTLNTQAIQNLKNNLVNNSFSIAIKTTEIYPTPVVPIFDPNQTRLTINYNDFVFGALKTCISDSCNNNVEERIKTYYHLHPSQLRTGTYRGEINIQY